MHRSDARFQTLRARGHTGGVNDMLLQWLNSFIVPENQQPALMDAWKEAILQEVPGLDRRRYQYNDYWYITLAFLGYFQPHISDRETAFWIGGGQLEIQEFVRVTDVPEDRVALVYDSELEQDFEETRIVLVQVVTP